MISENAVIGARIRRLRIALGFPTQRAFCRHFGFKPSQANNWETGDRRISLDAAAVLCGAGASLEWIYYGNTAYMPVSLMRAIEAVAEIPPEERA